MGCGDRQTDNVTWCCGGVPCQVMPAVKGTETTRQAFSFDSVKWRLSLVNVDHLVHVHEGVYF